MPLIKRLALCLLVYTPICAYAYNPAESAHCQAQSQTLLTQARQIATEKLIRISPAPPASEGNQPRKHDSDKPLNGTVVLANGNRMTLRQAILQAKAGSTLLLAEGYYRLPASTAPEQYTGLYIKQPRITVLGDTLDPSKVVIDGGYDDLGKTAGVLSVDAREITLANLTLKRSIFHLLHLWRGADEVTVHNVHFIDGGQQFLKASPGKGNLAGGTVQCSQFLMTQNGRDNVWGYGKPRGWTTCYTGGIDAHHSHNWTIANNRFEGIYCDKTGVPRPAHQRKANHRNQQSYQGGLAEHAIHLWHSKKGSGHTIKNNQIIDCARGIGIGLKDPVYGGLIMNNMIVSRFAGAREHDVGIAIYRAAGTKIVNNSIFYSHPSAYPNAIEILYESEQPNLVMNNLTNKMIRTRNGGQARITSNTYTADPAWFVASSQGDLHLKSCKRVPIPVASGSNTADVPVDIDGEQRGSIVHIGADQCVQ